LHSSVHKSDIEWPDDFHDHLVSIEALGAETPWLRGSLVIYTHALRRERKGEVVGTEFDPSGSSFFFFVVAFYYNPFARSGRIPRG